MSRAPLVAILVCLGAIGAPASALGAGVRTGPDGPAILPTCIGRQIGAVTRA